MHDESRPNVERYVAVKYSVFGRVSDLFRWYNELLALKEWKKVASTIESNLNP